jgi:hypothetical protein
MFAIDDSFMGNVEILKWGLLMARFKATNTQNVSVFFHAINNEVYIADHDKK